MAGGHDNAKIIKKWSKISKLLWQNAVSDHLRQPIEVFLGQKVVSDHSLHYSSFFKKNKVSLETQCYLYTFYIKIYRRIPLSVAG